MIVVRAAKVNAAKSKKRGLEEEEVEVSQKRLHAQPSTQRTQQEASNLGVVLCSSASELQHETTSRGRVSSPTLHQQDTGWVPVSQRLCSGRSMQPPSRYF